MTPVIRTQGLVKDYGRIRALDGLDLEVEAGQVFGFLGPNGAGKSTTIRLLLDLIHPTAGVVEVLGQSPTAGGPALRARIGYLPGEVGLPGRKTAGEYLHHLARLRDGRGADRIAGLADRFGLPLERTLRTLSRGNKQKVTVVQAFMHDPEVLVLDEPTSGLDPLLQREFRALVDEARERGATVFLSSHVLAEVEDIASTVAIVRAGRVVDVDDVRALRERAGQNVLLRFASPVLGSEFAGLPGVTDLVVRGTTVTCLLRGEPGPLLAAAARHHLVRWQAQDRELGDLFLDFYRDELPDGVGTPGSAGRVAQPAVAAAERPAGRAARPPAGVPPVPLPVRRPAADVEGWATVRHVRKRQAPPVPQLRAPRAPEAAPPRPDRADAALPGPAPGTTAPRPDAAAGDEESPR